MINLSKFQGRSFLMRCSVYDAPETKVTLRIKRAHPMTDNEWLVDGEGSDRGGLFDFNGAIGEDYVRIRKNYDTGPNPAGSDDSVDYDGTLSEMEDRWLFEGNVENTHVSAELTLTLQPSAEEVFEAFLHEQNKRGRTQWKRNDSNLHRVFYQAQEEFQEEMSCYADWLIRTETYSQRLEKMLGEFRQAGVLTSEDGMIVIRNAEALKKPDECLGKIVEYICDRYK